MKRFLRNISLFSLLIVIPLMAAEIYVRQMPNPSRAKHQWMLEHSCEVETLVLGNSHCFYGVNPSLLGERSYSLAQPTQSYRYDWYLLTHYPMPRLRTVILPCSYTSLFEDVESEPDMRYWAVRYRLYMDCDIHSVLSQYGFEFLHVASFREKLSSLWKPSRLSWDSLGFGTSYGTRSKLAEGTDNGVSRAKDNTYADMRSLQLCTSMLDSICGWCAQRQVRLVIVAMPVWSSFRNACDSRQLSVRAKVLKQVLKRHPSVDYFDFRADSSFVISDFYDADHLNQLGARKLTLMLKHEVEKPLQTSKQ
ncbi:MAG: hypothetical protein SOT67_09050 [Bacteroidaceae bacterium]|nr:hypothetical protein [Prevotellaceae bacterium]MDY2850376.1 hypothetical protein [Bacteroidaceae bacterium]